MNSRILSLAECRVICLPRPPVSHMVRPESSRRFTSASPAVVNELLGYAPASGLGELPALGPLRCDQLLVGGFVARLGVGLPGVQRTGDHGVIGPPA